MIAEKHMETPKMHLSKIDNQRIYQQQRVYHPDREDCIQNLNLTNFS